MTFDCALELSFWLQIHIVIFFIQVFHPAMLDNDLKQPHKCTPKSKRPKFWKIIAPTNKWLVTKARKTEEHSCSIKTNEERKLRSIKTQQATKQEQQQQKPSKTNSKFNAMRPMAFAAVAMQAEGLAMHDDNTNFDTDSGPVGINNQCTGCTSH